jgi:hypothetical protein
MLSVAILRMMCIVKLGVIILSVIMLSAAMLSLSKSSVHLCCVIMLSVTMLSLSKFQFIYTDTGCHFTECCYVVFVQKFSLFMLSVSMLNFVKLSLS